MGGLPFERIAVLDPKIQRDIGMQQAHAVRLQEFCNQHYKARRLLIIIRQSCPESLKWHGFPQHLPKPATLKAKINPQTGRTPSPPNLGEWELRRHGASPAGRLGGLRSPPVATDAHPGNGWWYISDYDLHGVYEKRHTGTYDRFFISNYVNHHGVRIGSKARARPHLNPFLHAINRFVCNAGPEHPERAFFQHGPEDDFRVAGRSGHRLFDGKPMEDRGKVTKPHIVFEPRVHHKDKVQGAVYLLQGPDVQAYFRARKLSYMW